MEHLELPLRSSFLYGIGAPDPSLGVDGNLYVDVALNLMYYKTAGVWSTVASPMTLTAGSGISVSALAGGQVKADPNNGFAVVAAAGDWLTITDVDGGDATTKTTAGQVAALASLQSAYNTSPSIVAVAPINISGGSGDIMTFTKATGSGRCININQSIVSGNPAVDITTSGTNPASALRLTGGSSGTASPLVVINTSAVTAGITALSTAGGIGLNLLHSNASAAAMYVRNTNAAGAIASYFGSSSGQVNLAVANAITTYTLTLPSAQGSAEQVMYNNGAGVLAWRFAPKAVAVAVPDTGWSGAGPYTYDITHSLGTLDVIVSIFDTVDNKDISVDEVERLSASAVRITSSTLPSPGFPWRVLFSTVSAS